MTHLNQVALGLSFGILWGAVLLLLSLTSMFWGYGTEWVDLLGTVYIGAGSGSFVAVIAGTVWAFVDGFVCGWLLSWLYNQLS